MSAGFDGDGDVDADDLLILEACATGPGLPHNPASLPAGCKVVPVNGIIPPDANNDGSVDQVDFALFQRCWSGPGVPGNPNCRS